MDFIDILSILGYPLVAWLAYKGGRLDGIEITIAVLHQRGFIELEEDPLDNQ